MSSIQQQFLKPSDEFTPIPFWFWNDQLTKEAIRRQIHDFYDKGVMGFVLHPRIGIPKDLVYLSDTFMGLVYTAVQEAQQLGMFVILYDEAMYPSGSAQGRVVKDNPEYATRGLKMIEYPCDGPIDITVDIAEDEYLVSAQAVRKISSSSIDFASISLLSVENGIVSFVPPTEHDWSVLLFVETFSQGTIRGIHFGEDDGEENAPPSADLLNPDAVAKFIQITHETYYQTLKEFFGNTVIAMFTDEPDLLGRNALPGLKPWTTDFLTYYIEKGNQAKYLPVLWFEAGEKTAEIRKRYRKTVNQKLTESYYQPISDWCAKHNIALTGHPEASDDIGLLEHFQIPGQDVVWRWVAPEDGKAIEGEHSTAGKCSADAARHRGRRRNLNEVLGVCSKESDWDLSPGDMKWYFDWLLVRGVNLICPHAFYYSIDGKRRSHERPPDVGPNNHWWPFYKQFSQYIKRLSWLMTDSTNLTSIAVLCEEDHLPWKIVKPLYEQQIEFNYLEESLLLTKSQIDNGTLTIANQAYQVIIIEDANILDQAVVEKLFQFINSGGHVIVCQKSEVKNVLPHAQMIASEEMIVKALPANTREEVVLQPSSSAIRFSKLKKDGKIFFFFVNEGEADYHGTFIFKEQGKLEKWDAWQATIEDQAVQEEGQRYVAPLTLNRRESIVYCLDIEQEPILTTELFPKVNVDTIEVHGQWFVTNKALALNKQTDLGLWQQWEGMEHFSGTVTYENSFEIDSLPNEAKIYLHLGAVYETAQVFINGHEVGVKMWAPYRMELDPSLVQQGKNQLTIHVTNSIANKMDQVSLKSGLQGPVQIEIETMETA